MSMSHHSAEEQEAQSRLLQQFLNKAQEHHSDGRLNRQDEGDLAFAVAADPRNQVILIDFGKPVKWCGMNTKQARMLAQLLLDKADELDKSTVPK